MKEKNSKYIIYKHTNLINGKSYIGITIHGENPNYRWEGGSGYFNQDKFYNDILKFGWNNFSHEILEENVEPINVDRKEREYIKLYDSYLNGYNASPGGNAPSDESREKISKALTGIKREQFSIDKQIQTKIKNSGGWKNGFDPVDSKITKKVRCKETGDVFGSISEAQKWSNTSKIGLCCAGIRKHAGRHPETNELLSWEFVPDDTEVTIRYNCFIPRQSKKIKKVMCINTGVIYNNATEAEKATGISRTAILRICKGEYETAYNTRWKYVDNNDEIIKENK